MNGSSAVLSVCVRGFGDGATGGVERPRFRLECHLPPKVVAEEQSS